MPFSQTLAIMDRSERSAEWYSSQEVAPSGSLAGASTPNTMCRRWNGQWGPETASSKTKAPFYVLRGDLSAGFSHRTCAWPFWTEEELFAKARATSGKPG